MNNTIGKVFDIFESEVKSVIKDIANPVKDKSVKYYLNENLEFLFICIELPGVLKENCNIEFTSNNIKISFVTSYHITTSENISEEDFITIDDVDIFKHYFENYNVKTLRLTSSGGQDFAGHQIRDLVQKYEIDTEAKGECSSACSFIFIAGKNRSLIGNNPDFYELDHFESVDVDTPFDFFIAEQIYNEYFKNK